MVPARLVFGKGGLSEGVLYSPVGDTLSGQFDQNASLYQVL